METRITTDNLPLVLGSPINQLPTVLPALFEKLLEPDQDEIFLRNYVVESREILGLLSLADGARRPPLNNGLHAISEARVN
jgi:hypothetical protein